MRVVCLSENTAGNNSCNTEHGLCFYIETGNHKVLMDTGASDLFAENAGKCGVNLNEVDTVVISHGHYDHGGGLPYFLKINDHAKVYIQKTAFGNYYSIREEGPAYIGLMKELQENERIVQIEGDCRIDSSLFLFSGIGNEQEVPTANERIKVKKDGVLVQDDFEHEQCLVIREKGQTFLFSGCAHHGILNILNRYKELFGKEPDAVFSGFHMQKKNGYSDEDINMIIHTALELKKYNTKFRTCHCTGTAPYEAMKKIMGDQLEYIHCGDEVVIHAERTKGGYMKFHKLFAWGTVFCFAMSMITGYRRK